MSGHGGAANDRGTLFKDKEHVMSKVKSTVASHLTVERWLRARYPHVYSHVVTITHDNDGVRIEFFKPVPSLIERACTWLLCGGADKGVRLATLWIYSERKRAKGGNWLLEVFSKDLHEFFGNLATSLTAELALDATSIEVRLEQNSPTAVIF